MTGRDRLLQSLAPELVEAIEEIVDERMRERLAVNPVGLPSPGSPWLSLEEAAEYLRVSVRTLERQLGRKRVRSTTIGRRRLLHRDDLDELARATPGEEKRQPLHPDAARE